MDLRLIITADAEDAKRELAAVEGGIAKVESRSQQATPSVKAVVDALTGQGEAAKRTTQEHAKLTETTERLTGTQRHHGLALNASRQEYVDYMKALLAADVAADQARRTTGAHTAALAANTLGLTQSQITMGLWSAAAGAALAVYTAFLGVLTRSIQTYFEHAEATRDSREALADLAETWEATQLIIGGSILGENFSIVRPITLFNLALLTGARRIASMAEEARILVRLLERMADLLPGGMGTRLISQPIEEVRQLFSRVPETPESLFLNPLTPPDPMRALKQADDFFREWEREQARLQRMREQEARRWQAFLDSLSGREAIQDAQEFMRAVEAIGGATRLAADDQERYNTALTAGLDAMRRLSRDGSPQMIAMLREWVALQRANFVGPGIIGSLSPETLAGASTLALLRQQVQRTIGTLGVPGSEGPELILQPLELVPELSDQTIEQNLPHIVDSVVHPFRDAFKALGEELPHLLFQALAGGGPLVSSLAAGLGAVFASEFQRAIANLPRDAQGRPQLDLLTPGQRALGLAGMGLSSFVGGFNIGASTNRTTGALAGAASGAAMGANPALIAATGGWSIAVGAGIGLIGGLFGGGQSERERREQLEENRQALIQQFGGLEELTRLTDQLGVSMDRAFDSDNPRDFEFAVMMLNNALEQMNRRIATINRLTETGELATPEELLDIVRTRGTDEENEAIAAFLRRQVSTAASGLTLLTENAPLASAESVSGAASALAVLGQQMIDMGLDATEIAETLLPILDKLDTRMRELGVEGGEAFDRIAAHVRLFTDEAARPSIDAISGVVQTLTGLNNMGLLNQEMFSGLARNIVEVRDSLIDQGFSAEQAFAIIRPGLQEIWELQQDFGFEVDESTQALIDQGLQAGTIGEQFRDPMRQMIDAVKELVEKLEQVLIKLGLIPGEAQEAVDGWNDAWDGAVDPPHGPGRPPDNMEDPTGPEPGLPHAHTGGFLWRGAVLPMFHEGGSIDARAWRIAHTGGLAPDEFPLIAQTGEFMFRRNAVQFWGRENLAAMNDLRLPLASARDRGASVSSSSERPMMTIVLERDGEREAEWLVPFVTGEAQRLRLA